MKTKKRITSNEEWALEKQRIRQMAERQQLVTKDDDDDSQPSKQQLDQAVDAIKQKTGITEIESRVQQLEDLKADLEEQMKQQKPGMPGYQHAGFPGSRGKGKGLKALAQYVSKGEVSPDLADGLPSLTSKGLSISLGNATDGGALIFTDVSDQLKKVLKDNAPLRGLVTVKQTDSNQYDQVVSLGGAQTGRALEGGTRNETNAPKSEVVSINLFEGYCQPKATNEWLASNQFDGDTWLLSELGLAFGEQETTEILTGDPASGQCQGILTSTLDTAADAARAFGTIQKIVTAGSGVISGDDLVKLVYSLKAAYRPGAVWCMSSDTLEVIRVMKNGEGDYIWRESLAEGQPSRLLGYPVVETPQMPATAAGTLPVLFGNLNRGYILAENERGALIVRDVFTEKGFTKFYTTRFYGGNVTDSNAIKVLEVKA